MYPLSIDMRYRTIRLRYTYVSQESASVSITRTVLPPKAQSCNITQTLR